MITVNGQFADGMEECGEVRVQSIGEMWKVGDGDKRYRVGLFVRTFTSFSRLRKIFISILG